MPDAPWRRIAGFRVVVSWPETEYAPPPAVAGLRARVAGITGVLLIVAGIAAVGVAVASQVHAPQPSLSEAGVIGGSSRQPSLARSVPVAVRIPAIGVDSKLLRLGLNADGTVQVPSIRTSAGRAAWYKYSATPGQIGSSVIAKVHRDRLMAGLGPEEFAFAENAGYPSPAHQEALAALGPTPHHRLSWSYLDDLPRWRHLKRPRPDVEGQLSLL